MERRVGNLRTEEQDVSNLVIPNSFAAGTTISAYQMNSNFAAISSWANTNVDHSNIGSDGIYASQVIPASSAQATFGGSFGYTISPGVAAQVPLTVAGTSFQTSDLFDVLLAPGGAKALAVTAAGATALLGPLQSASGYVPPVYNYDGTATGTTEHIARDRLGVTQFDGRLDHRLAFRGCGVLLLDELPSLCDHYDPGGWRNVSN
jgi:hypothetical protein